MEPFAGRKPRSPGPNAGRRYKKQGESWPRMEDDDPRRKLIDDNRGIAGLIAKRYVEEGKRFGLTFDDLVSAGYEGLLEAAYRYDEGAKNGFCTFAGHWIHRYIRNEIHRQNVIHIPRCAFRPENRDRPFFAPFVAAASRVGSFGMMTDGLDGRVVFDVDPRPSDPSLDIERRDDLAALDRALARLSEQERTVLRMRGEDATLREVADQLGCSYEWVRQVQRTAMRKLRAEMGAPEKGHRPRFYGTRRARPKANGWSDSLTSRPSA